MLEWCSRSASSSINDSNRICGSKVTSTECLFHLKLIEPEFRVWTYTGRNIYGISQCCHQSSFPTCISFSKNLWMRVQYVGPENPMWRGQSSSLQSSWHLSLETLRAVCWIFSIPHLLSLTIFHLCADEFKSHLIRAMVSKELIFNVFPLWVGRVRLAAKAYA